MTEPKKTGITDEAIDRLGYSYQTLADGKYVALNVQFSDRSEKLSWLHHRQVAKFEPEQQKEWNSHGAVKNTAHGGDK